MIDKTEKIVDAAAAMFGRYGYSKTTMGDIAAEAGVSRQTVYNAFPGKEEILRAAVRKYGQTAQHEVVARWADAADFVEKIDLFHTHVPLKWFELMQASPAWADLMEGMHIAAAEEVRDIDHNWRIVLTEIFTAELRRMMQGTRPAEDIVDFFYNASVNAKHGARDLDHLRRRLATIKAATLGLMA